MSATTMDHLRSVEIVPNIRWTVFNGDVEVGWVLRTREGRPGYELDSYWPNGRRDICFTCLWPAMTWLASTPEERRRNFRPMFPELRGAM